MRNPTLLCVVLALSALGCPKPTDDDERAAPWTEGQFPGDFWWGTAVAGFQVEAGCPTLPAASCTDPHSDWYQFVMSPELRAESGLHLSGDDLSAAPGFYETYAADVARAKTEVGSNTFRVSLEWSRIFPSSTRGISGFAALQAAANADALAYYHRLLQAVRAQGLRPLVTVHHYTLPLWIHDGLACHQDLSTCAAKGWLDESMIAELAKYSGFVAQEFGAEVDWWATQNEPMAVVLAGYVAPGESRSNPPGLSMRLVEAKTVMAHMEVAHAKQFDAIKAGDTVDADGDGAPAQVGLVFSIAPVAAANPANPLDVQAAEDVNYIYNLAFLQAVVLGDFDGDLDGVPEHRADMAGRMDYLGINYYATNTAQGTLDGNPVFPALSPRTRFNYLTLTQDWNNPRGIYDAVMMAKPWNVPVLITENGAQNPDDSDDAVEYMVQHLAWLSRAIRDGAPVRGYLWWTLMDNYEWNHGMDIRMGLYAVGTDAAKTRTARKTVGVFKSIASTHQLPAELLAKYPLGAAAQ